MKAQPVQKKAALPKEDKESEALKGKSMAPPAFALKSDEDAAPVQKKDDGANPIQKQDAGAQGVQAAAAVPATPVIDTTAQATWHYFNGGGKSVDIGPNTIASLLATDKFKEKHARITGGLTSSLTGNFSVDMTSEVFHIGRTNVQYEVVVNGDQCTVNYTLFANDGYWDVDELDEKVLGDWLGIDMFKPDGMGPNLERGGDPYHYNTSAKSYTFTNPGY